MVASQTNQIMQKNVIICIKGIQTSMDNSSNTLELITEGRYYKKENSYFITYNESEVTGMEGTITTLKISDEGVITLMRIGMVNTQFIFEEGQKHMSYYDTTQGTYVISVITNNMDVKVNDSGGEIKVDYCLEIDDNKAGNNDLYMFIREVQEENLEVADQ